VSGLAGLHVESVGSGPPLLVCHGGPGLDHRLYRALDPLADERQLVYWDHRGHGRSGPLPDGPIEIAHFADDAIAVADGLGLGRFSVFGHSFGGWVAPELVLRHPERVATAIFAATSAGHLGATEPPDDDQGPPPPPEVQSALASIGSMTTGAELAEMFRSIADQVLVRGDRAAYLAQFDPEVASVPAMRAVFDALSRWSSVDRLAEVTCPVLVLAGRHDVFTSWPQSRRIASRIPGAELVILEHAGHFLWLDEAEAFFATVRRWLAAHA
jgi:proline iminopeptidase